MELLFTVSDVFNTTNINLAERLGATDNGTQYVENWCKERQDEILDYIGSYAWDGRRQAERYTQSPYFAKTIVEAIMYQIQYVVENEGQNNIGGILLHSRGMSKLSMKERLEAGIAPRAHRVLENHGLLYRGRT